jgi:hypothetical protein
MQQFKMINKNQYRYSFILLFICALLLMPGSESRGHEFSRETAVVKAVREVSPAVVNISSAVQMRKRTSPFSGAHQSIFGIRL